MVFDLITVRSCRDVLIKMEASLGAVYSIAAALVGPCRGSDASDGREQEIDGNFMGISRITNIFLLQEFSTFKSSDCNFSTMLVTNVSIAYPLCEDR